MEIDDEKALAARAAAVQVRAGQRVALGTGSTTSFAIRVLAENFPGGDHLSIVASSLATERLATSLGLPVRPLEPGDHFDVMIDGADEVAPTLALTKGGGGALFREKFLARLSSELVIAVDHTKLVPRLGTRHPIPIEIVPFARARLVHQLSARALSPRLRSDRSTAAPTLTDNGNEILDLFPENGVEDPARLEHDLRVMPGVIETGLFVGLAHRVYVGLPDGTVQEILRGDASSS
ncbi:MAG: ribose-5-phosphate isomerase RpiA [Thermoplasmata archaeon]|nr:ribose-5-phosphate isomerase RpiA [Thermoplasmata archaeon]